MTDEERAAKKAAYTGPTYETADPIGQGPCRACGMTIYWVRTPDGANMPVEEDGIPHWGFCTDPGRFKK